MTNMPHDDSKLQFEVNPFTEINNNSAKCHVTQFSECHLAKNQYILYKQSLEFYDYHPTLLSQHSSFE